MEPHFYVYILTNKYHNVLYVGSTSDLKKRMYFHKHRLIAGFTKKYNVDKLVYFECFDEKAAALDRERKIKDGPRKNKVKLIEFTNQPWHDLYNQIS